MPGCPVFEKTGVCTNRSKCSQLFHCICKRMNCQGGKIGCEGCYHPSIKKTGAHANQNSNFTNNNNFSNQYEGSYQNYPLCGQSIHYNNNSISANHYSSNNSNNNSYSSSNSSDNRVEPVTLLGFKYYLNEITKLTGDNVKPVEEINYIVKGENYYGINIVNGESLELRAYNVLKRLIEEQSNSS